MCLKDRLNSELEIISHFHLCKNASWKARSPSLAEKENSDLLCDLPADCLQFFLENEMFKSVLCDNGPYSWMRNDFNPPLFQEINLTKRQNYYFGCCCSNGIVKENVVKYIIMTLGFSTKSEQLPLDFEKSSSTITPSITSTLQVKTKCLFIWKEGHNWHFGENFT